MTTLDEHEWRKVFELRCKSKRGHGLSENEQALVERAYRADPARYAAMNGEVFQATLPFGADGLKPR